MTPQNKMKVVCPQCGQVLWFVPVPGYQSKSMRCPKCGFRAKYSEFANPAAPAPANQPAYDAGAPTEIYNPAGAATEIYNPNATGNYNIPRATNVAQLRVMLTGQIHRLSVGHNVIGRKAISSTADLQIEGDPYMSRRHVDIEVIQQPDGSYQYRLNEINSKNIVKLNGREIHRNDILLLAPGDELTMGQTNVKLVEDDQTLIL